MKNTKSENRQANSLVNNITASSSSSGLPPPTISGGSLAAGNTITIEAFGSFADPASSAPHAIFTLKLGSAIIVTTANDVPACGWHLRASITVRSSGTTGTVVSSIAVVMDNIASAPTATVNTTTSLSVDLLASIANATGAESVICDQLTNRRGHKFLSDDHKRSAYKSRLVQRSCN